MCNTGIIVNQCLNVSTTFKHINVSTSYCEHCGCALCMRVYLYVCVYGLLPD